jgi:hypothetical protein
MSVAELVGSTQTELLKCVLVVAIQERIRSLFYRSHRGYLGKERIMEVYLNSIEMGMVYTGSAGFGTLYRKKLLILPIQAAGIAAILNPRKYTAEFSSYINNRKQKLCDAYRWKNTILDVLKKLFFYYLMASVLAFGQGN